MYTEILELGKEQNQLPHDAIIDNKKINDELISLMKEQNSSTNEFVNVLKDFINKM